MPRPKELDVDPAAVDPDGFADGVTGTALTLIANDSGDGLAHQVSILDIDGNGHAGKTVTLVGTDPNGDALTEVVTGPGASAAVESAGYFLTLDSATFSTTPAPDVFDLGWVDEVATQAVPLDHYASTAATVSVDVTGTINYTVQETFDLFQAPNSNAISWVAVTALSAKTADLTSAISKNATAVRLIVNSYSATAEIQMTVLQSRD